jgi:hypothetical protein
MFITITPTGRYTTPPQRACRDHTRLISSDGGSDGGSEVTCI